jgi:Raf kinase inhibitor-like YbhB/YbcL family protein
MKKIFFIFIVSVVMAFCCEMNAEAVMKISSPAFPENGPIPVKYTCQGDDLSPPLDIADIPKQSRSLVLIVDDPDAPMGTWVHWTVYNIPPDTSRIDENTIPGQQGWNDFQQRDWGGPCPPSGTHRYFFKIYALDAELSPLGKMAKKDIEGLMKGHILDQAQAMGTYKKK